MSSLETNQFHFASAKKSILVHASCEEIWQKIRNITGLEWVLEVEKAIFLSKIKTGPGAIRRIFFSNGDTVDEIIVGWKQGSYLSYIAIKGLPLRAYHASISIKSLNNNESEITWECFFNTENMSKKEFLEFHDFINLFYKNSLLNLKTILENQK